MTPASYGRCLHSSSSTILSPGFFASSCHQRSNLTRIFSGNISDAKYFKLALRCLPLCLPLCDVWLCDRVKGVRPKMQDQYTNYFSIFPNWCSSHCPSLVSPPYASSTRSLANDRVSDLLGCCCPQMSSTQSVSPVHGLSTQVHRGPPPPPSPRPPPCPTPCPVIIVHILIHLNAIRIPCPQLFQLRAQDCI